MASSLLYSSMLLVEVEILKIRGYSLKGKFIVAVIEIIVKLLIFSLKSFQKFTWFIPVWGTDFTTETNVSIFLFCD